MDFERRYAYGLRLVLYIIVLKSVQSLEFLNGKKKNGMNIKVFKCFTDQEKVDLMLRRCLVLEIKNRG